MFGKRIEVFKLFGIAVRLDLSWVIIAVLVTWSLARGFFPSEYPNLSRAICWVMGVAGAVGLFGSILFHEFSHALVARRYGLVIKGITLFIFGGVAEMEREPSSPKAEFLMAAAGPIASILLAMACYGTYLAGERAGWPEPPIGVARYLGLINGLLAAFNLIPGFPLDGGRLLRSVLWVWKRNLRWATRITSQIGAGFGLVLIFLGILNMLRGEFAGLWWLLIGLFLRDAATTSYQQLLLRKALEGEPVRRFMISTPVTVPASSSIEQLVEGYIYRHHFKMYPVVEDGTLLGCVTIRQVKAIPRNEWKQHTVREVATPCSPENTVHPEDDAMKALSTMSRTGDSRLMVVEGNQLVGIIALKDMLGLLSLKVELEEPKA